jgi:hypothetical protein
MSDVFIYNTGSDVTIYSFGLPLLWAPRTYGTYVKILESMEPPPARVRVVSKLQVVFESPVKGIATSVAGVRMKYSYVAWIEGSTNP